MFHIWYFKGNIIESFILSGPVFYKSSRTMASYVLFPSCPKLQVVDNSRTFGDKPLCRQNVERLENLRNRPDDFLHPPLPPPPPLLPLLSFPLLFLSLFWPSHTSFSFSSSSSPSSSSSFAWALFPPALPLFVLAFPHYLLLLLLLTPSPSSSSSSLLHSPTHYLPYP